MADSEVALRRTLDNVRSRSNIFCAMNWPLGSYSGGADLKSLLHWHRPIFGLCNPLLPMLTL